MKQTDMSRLVPASIIAGAAMFLISYYVFKDSLSTALIETGTMMIAAAAGNWTYHKYLKK